MSWPTTFGDWAFIVGAFVLAHGLFLVGSHIGWWGTDSQGHIHFN